MDKAIRRYFSNIASRRNNHGFISDRTKTIAINATRRFLNYIHRPIQQDTLYDLIQEYKQYDGTAENAFLDTLQDFSNQTPITTYRLLASYVKGIFKANRCRLEVFVDNHFSTKTQRIPEGRLRAIVAELTPRQQQLCKFLAYTGERRKAVCTLPLALWTPTEKHWILNIPSENTKARISHPCFIPKGLGDKLRTFAEKKRFTCAFPDYDYLLWQITKSVAFNYNSRLTAHYFRKRFATIAANTNMPPNDWDYLQGSKMSIGHCADIYQLQDYIDLENKYELHLEKALSLDPASISQSLDSPDQTQSQVQLLQTDLAKAYDIIHAQQTAITNLTNQLTQLQALQLRKRQ